MLYLFLLFIKVEVLWIALIFLTYTDEVVLSVLGNDSPRDVWVSPVFSLVFPNTILSYKILSREAMLVGDRERRV